MSKAASVIALAFLLALGTGAAATPAAKPTGSWTGSYTLNRVDPITVAISGNRATVALGPGHAGRQVVPATVRNGRLRFSLPGVPRVAFDGKLHGRRIVGSVRQGSLKGTFSLRRGAARGLLARGLYGLNGRTFAVAGGRLLDTETGEVHALYPSGTGFDVGSGLATRNPVRGTARFDATGATLPAGRATRMATRQLEVRFRSGGTMLAGTLTLPPEAGPHPAVVWVHGGGFQTRDTSPTCKRCS